LAGLVFTIIEVSGFFSNAGERSMTRRDRNIRRRLIGLAILFATVFAPVAAEAYVGPGLGLSVIGTIFAFVGAVFLAIVGFIWYPIKRLFRRRGKNDASPSTQADTDELKRTTR